MTGTDVAREWWDGAVGYEVYARSFADANGDGIGDLPGIRRRLPHLVDLGVDAVWLTPFYPGPGFDHGYDVSDYRDVNPIHGTLGDFDDLVAEAKRLGLRIIVDIVPNHTSSHHPWFRQAVADPASRHRDYYLWRHPASDGGPPNNWVSHFGGPAWTPDPGGSGDYYCHLFLPEQPDLNWANEDVRDEFDAILTFWLERGVDGFRIDVAHSLTKDPWFHDNPLMRPLDGVTDPREVFRSYEHRYDLDQNTNIAVFRRWNKLVEPYGAMLLGETGPDDPVRLPRYHDEGHGIHRNFYLAPVWWEWDPMRLRDGVRAIHLASPDSISWTIDNHDSSRSVTRFGGGPRGALRSLTVTTLMFGLGGMPFLWQGQELGIPDGVVAESNLADPVATRNPGAIAGRDGTRTAMPWDDTANNGFTTADQAWLPSQPRPRGETVAGQQPDRDSWLHRHRHLLAFRRAHPDMWRAPLRWLETDANLLVAYHRGDVIVAANLDEHPARLDLPDDGWQVGFAGDGAAHQVDGTTVEIPAETAIILTTA